VFSLCFYTIVFKVLSLSVLSVEDNFKGGLTTKTSGNENHEGDSTVSIVGPPWSITLPLVIQSMQRLSLCRHCGLHDKASRL